MSSHPRSILDAVLFWFNLVVRSPPFANIRFITYYGLLVAVKHVEIDVDDVHISARIQDS